MEAKYISIDVKMRVNEQTENTPLLNKTQEMWRGTINLEDNSIIGWPKGIAYNVFDKVSDQGSYALLSEDKYILSSIEEDYVPIGCLPGDSDDYLDLEVDENGIVQNMPTHLDFCAFDNDEECDYQEDEDEWEEEQEEG